MQVRFYNSIEDIEPDTWNRLFGTDYPFTRHEFLLALEQHDCTTKKTGWQAHHALVFREEHAVAALPLFVKDHSYGEYIFDWSWADAYQRSGRNYYPKLLSAIPFTPATGPRLGFDKSVDSTIEQKPIIDALINAIQDLAADVNLSSWHILYPDEETAQAFVCAGLPLRHSSQFHWFNDNYQTFEDFLATFNSRKRKALKKERRRVEAQSVKLRLIEGSDIDANNWNNFYRFYQITYAKRSGHGGYLNKGFFQQIADSIPEHIVMALAERDGEAVAGALYFRSSDTLYGRYWGCTEEIDCLHFEACYYQGIEYCIRNGLKKFDPGAQGEHKIQRGFRPIKTFSNHWIADPDFSAAIEDFTVREAEHIDNYIHQASSYLPFKAPP